MAVAYAVSVNFRIHDSIHAKVLEKYGPARTVTLIDIAVSVITMN
jgi:hypothetical protein